MTQTVWKYAITDTDQRVNMPAGATPLTVAGYNGQPVVWCLVNPKALPVERRIILTATGKPLPEGDWIYIGLYVPHPGYTVFHIFIDSEPERQA